MDTGSIISAAVIVLGFNIAGLLYAIASRRGAEGAASGPPTDLPVLRSGCGNCRHWDHSRAQETMRAYGPFMGATQALSPMQMAAGPQPPDPKERGAQMPPMREGNRELLASGRDSWELFGTCTHIERIIHCDEVCEGFSHRRLLLRPLVRRLRPPTASRDEVDERDPARVAQQKAESAGAAAALADLGVEQQGPVLVSDYTRLGSEPLDANLNPTGGGEAYAIPKGSTDG